jgi:hypothetical protein
MNVKILPARMENSEAASTKKDYIRTAFWELLTRQPGLSASFLSQRVPKAWRKLSTWSKETY